MTWRTDRREGRGFGQIAIAADGPLFWDTTVWARTRTVETNLGRANYHTVEFRDLEPDTEYMYRVGDGINWSEWFHFRTASAEACRSFRSCAVSSTSSAPKFALEASRKSSR